MASLIILIKPQIETVKKLTIEVNAVVNYTKLRINENDEKEKLEFSGQITELLPLILTTSLAIKDYFEDTKIDFSITNKQGTRLFKMNELMPKKDARKNIFILEIELSDDVISRIQTEVTPRIPPLINVLSRAARFVAIGFTAPNYKDYSLLVAPISKENFTEELLLSFFQVGTFRTISRRLNSALISELTTLPIQSSDNINVELNGRFTFNIPLPNNLGDSEKGWLWILSGPDTFIGIFKENSFEAITHEISILLPAPIVEESDDNESFKPLTSSGAADVRSTLPTDVSEEELLSNPDLFSEDPGTYCKPFSNPNRIVNEHKFKTILRVEQPNIGGNPSVPPDREQPPYSPVTNALDVGPAMLASRTDNSTGQPIGMFAKLVHQFTPSNTRSKIKLARNWTLAKSRGRYVLSDKDALDWEGDSFPYQATSLAFGHILESRVRTRSAGYSLGNVNHSLTLAPRQIKKIVTIESQIMDKAQRAESASSSDAIDQTTKRIYAYQDAVESELNEWSKGGSSSSTTGVAGGAGFVIPPFAVGGGASHGSANSDSWKRGGREVSAKEEQYLRDAIRQHGESIRNKQSLVVVEQNQEEGIQGVSEVVRNPNYGHSLTIIYHEILRHLRVDTEVVGASECVFVPFALKPFSFERALRWRDILETHLKKRQLRWVLSYLSDLSSDGEYIGSTVPAGARSKHPITFVTGSLYIKLAIERPRDDDSDNFSELAWLPLMPFLATPARAIWTKIIKITEEKRDEYFQRVHAPIIAASWVNTLVIDNIDGVDFTLASNYKFNKTVKVNFTFTSEDGSTTRETLQNIRVGASEPLPEKSVANVISASMEYYTSTFNRKITSSHGANDLIVIEDGSAGPEAMLHFPLSDWEKQDMRLEITTAAKDLTAHLNEHGEYYHKVIWWSMDRDKLYMMLDGIYISEEDTRSVASVVERDPIAIIGNSLVYSVSGGAHIKVNGIETPTELNDYYRDTSTKSVPMRVSLPTSGLYAQAIMDGCEALEEHFGSTEWVLSDQDLELAELGPELFASRRASTPNLQPTEFSAPIINLQNAATPPAPSGLGSAFNAIVNPNAFGDMAGLAGTQANARASMESAAKLASDFGSKALDLQKSERAASIANDKLNILKKAKAENLADEAKIKSSGNSVLDSMVEDDIPAMTAKEIEAIAKTSDVHDRDIEVDKKAEKVSITATKSSNIQPKKSKKSNLIDFGEGNGDIFEPVNVSNDIEALAGKMESYFQKLHDTSQNALNQFQLTMIESNAPPVTSRLGGMFGTILFSFVENLTINSPIGKAVSAAAPVTIAVFKDFVGEVGNQLNENGQNIANNQNNSIVDWISSQIAGIDHLTRFNTASAVEKIQLEYDNLVEDNRLKFIESVRVMTSFYDDEGNIPSLKFIQVQLFEKWINAHYIGITLDASGCLALEIDKEEDGISFDSFTILAPKGAEIALRLNQLNIKPFSLNVRKKICFDLDGIRKCVWIGKTNQTIAPDIPARPEYRAWFNRNKGSILATSALARFFN
ncbi:MAG: hypothetical protein WBC60_12455 [Cognaticolwellia sp.]